MPNYIYIAQSLDGFIARENGGIDWLMDIPNPEGSDYGFVEFMKGIDALIMGRKTFETVVSFDEWIYEVPVFVFSKSMKQIPVGYDDKAQLISGKPADIAQTLGKKGYKNLYIDGGQTIHSFLREGLIDEFIITSVPILLGSGIPLFPPLDKDIKLELLSTETLGSQLVKNTYKIKK